MQCADDGAYAVYGDIIVDAHYTPFSIFGSDSGDFIVLNYSDLVEEFGDDWGLEYLNLWIRDQETSATVYHVWEEPTYEWNDDHTQYTATRVCKNDPTHIETETVEVTSEVTVQPTCTENGETTYTSGKFENEAFNAAVISIWDVANLGHTAGEWDITVAPTCTDKGERKRYYVTCGELLDEEEVDANGHVEAIDAAVPATCAESGLTEGKHCSVCGTIIVAQETVNALGPLGLVNPY